MVADTLSRIPGSELLTSFELCSLYSTLGVQHVEDLPVKLLAPVGACADVSTCSRQLFDKCSLKLLNGVISIHERDSFRQQLL